MDNRPRNYNDGVGEANVVMKHYSSQDRTLDSHAFGNIPLKQLDFRSPEIKPFMRITSVDSKKEAFLYALDKLRVMFDLGYKEGDF